MVLRRGLSDFHKLVVTIYKCICQITSQRLSVTKTIKTLAIVVFLRSCCLEALNKNKSIFHNAIEVLEKYAPEKQKHIRANQAGFMDSKLNHAIMLRSKLLNNILKSRSNKDREAYKKQRKLCVSLLRQHKKDYFETLDIKSVTDNKVFWKRVAPLFSNKT